MKLTIDTNVLIGMEKDEVDPLKLLKKCIEGEVQLYFSAATAYDNKRVPKVSSIAPFKSRIQALGLDEKNILPTIQRWGISFYGFGIWGNPEGKGLEEKIFNIIFSNEPYQYQEYCKLKNYSENTIHPGWRNKICDTQILWSHLHAKNDIFVTSDNDDFHKHKSQLEKLGDCKIMYPGEVLIYLDNLNSSKVLNAQ